MRRDVPDGHARYFVPATGTVVLCGMRVKEGDGVTVTGALPWEKGVDRCRTYPCGTGLTV